MKADIEMEKIIKFGDIETEKQNFHQHKEPISIENIDIDKITVSNNVPFAKKDLNILSSTKMLKNIDLYVYFPQKWQNIEKTLMKLNLCLF